MLEITEVRVERLNEISEADAVAEGVEAFDGHFSNAEHAIAAYRTGFCIDDNRTPFAVHWESLNGKGAWAANPWLWAISSKRIPA